MKNYYDYGCGKCENYGFNNDCGCMSENLDNSNENCGNNEASRFEQCNNLGGRQQNCNCERCAKVYTISGDDCECNASKNPCQTESNCNANNNCGCPSFFCFKIRIPPFPFC